MPWKEHLGQLIASGQEASTLESREILESLIEMPAEERWQMILNRDPLLGRLVPEDYQWLVKVTSTLKSFELLLPPQLSAQMTQHAKEMAKTVEASKVWIAEQLDKQATDLMEGITFAQEDLARRSAEITQHLRSSQEFAKTFDQKIEVLTGHVESSQKSLGKRVEKYFSIGMAGQFLLPLLGVVILFAMDPNFGWLGSIKQSLETISKSSESSALKINEQLRKQSETLLQTLQASQAQSNQRVNQIFEEVSRHQEQQRAALWKIMVVDELGLRLAEGADFRSELAALRIMWADLPELPALASGPSYEIPGRPVLSAKLEQLYSDVQNQRLMQEATNRWNPWWSWSRKACEAKYQIEQLENRVHHSVESIRSGNWNTGVESLAEVGYPTIQKWHEMAQARLALEEWYSDLRKKVWSKYSSETELKKRL